MGGFLVLSIGQEGIAAAVRSVMRHGDHSISGWRGMGHALAAGIRMKPMASELLGRVSGCSKGKAGMFSFFEPSKHHWGCHATAAAQTPLAAGLGFALKYRKTAGAAVCFLGEGAVNQGVYHETLNLASLFGLPVVFVIENNGYSMGTSEKRSSAFRGCLARRAEGYGIDWDYFEDGDIYEIRARVGAALKRARVESRPAVIEIQTYRYYGATVADANNKRYRSPEEIEDWKNNRDSLMLWKNTLLKEQVLDENEVVRIDLEAKEKAFSAVDFAHSFRPPSFEELTTDVYSEVDERGEESLQGRYFF